MKKLYSLAAPRLRSSTRRARTISRPADRFRAHPGGSLPARHSLRARCHRAHRRPHRRHPSHHPGGRDHSRRTRRADALLPEVDSRLSRRPAAPSPRSPASSSPARRTSPSRGSATSSTSSPSTSPCPTARRSCTSAFQYLQPVRAAEGRFSARRIPSSTSSGTPSCSIPAATSRAISRSHPR